MLTTNLLVQVFCCSLLVDVNYPFDFNSQLTVSISSIAPDDSSLDALVPNFILCPTCMSIAFISRNIHPRVLRLNLKCQKLPNLLLASEICQSLPLEEEHIPRFPFDAFSLKMKCMASKLTMIPAQVKFDASLHYSLERSAFTLPVKMILHPHPHGCVDVSLQVKGKLVQRLTFTAWQITSTWTGDRWSKAARVCDSLVHMDK